MAIPINSVPILKGKAAEKQKQTVFYQIKNTLPI